MPRLFHHLQLAAHQLKQYADRHLLEAAGVTAAQAAVLVVVAEPRESTQRSVAQRLRVSEPAMTAMVERLVGAGLIERHRSPRDGRVRVLRLTGDGQRGLAAAEGAFARVHELIDDALGPDEVARVDASLEQLVSALSEVR